jgi:hypothetical protein
MEHIVESLIFLDSAILVDWMGHIGHKLTHTDFFLAPSSLKESEMTHIIDYHDWLSFYAFNRVQLHPESEASTIQILFSSNTMLLDISGNSQKRRQEFSHCQYVWWSR